MKKIFAALTILLSSSVVLAEEPNMKTSTETFKDWQIACVEQDNNRRCEMKQTLVNQKKQPVAVLSLVKKTRKDFLMQIALPHFLDLSVPVILTIDSKKIAELPYKYCNRVACFIVIENSDSIFSAFRKGEGGTIQAETVSKANLKLNFSLSGFSAASANLPDNS